MARPAFYNQYYTPSHYTKFGDTSFSLKVTP